MATINDVDDLKEELENAATGTDIVLDPDKKYYCNSDTTIRVNAENVRVIGFGPKFVENENFNPEDPEDGRAVIKGDGELTFKDCKGLQIIGFFSRLPFVMDDCEDCKVDYCDFQYDKNDVDVFILKNGVKDVISHCKFHDRETKGLFLKIQGEDTKDNVVEACEFWGHRFPGDNGGEPIRIGNSDLSGCEFNTTVRYCHFHDLRGDPETVSIKSCGNVLENNLHENCKSNFTIRHGGFNKIRNNVFKGSGGIRVLGDGNEIIGNYHQNNDNNDFRPLAIENGNEDKDPNFDSDGKPSGKKADDTHDEYARAKNNLIEGNIYDNCEGTYVVWGRKDRDRKPTGNTFRNNTIIADDEDSTFLKFENGAEVDDNHFEDNRLYGENAKRGDIPEQAIKKLSTKPEIRMPDAGPKVPEVAAAHS
jgi:poly(beta-D-mannuronate) lyase